MLSNGAGVYVDPTGASNVTYLHNNRGYLGQCSANWNPNGFTQLPLLSHSISFTVNLSDVGCGCNVGMYLVAMPARDQSGKPVAGPAGDYYCDANKVEGSWCPEIDMVEANREALQATPHACAPPNAAGHYTLCDRGGCALNTHKLDPQAYGPGPQYTIDTTAPFRVITTFSGSAGEFTTMTTTLRQGSSKFVMTHTEELCGSGYLSSLSQVVRAGMVPVFTSWGDTGSSMAWLDVPPCLESTPCNGASDPVVFSSIEYS